MSQNVLGATELFHCGPSLVNNNTNMPPLQHDRAARQEKRLRREMLSHRRSLHERADVEPDRCPVGGFLFFI